MDKKKTITGETISDNHQILIEACKRGEQRAQFQIYKMYYKAMYNLSLGIVNDSAEAEDIMQESFLTAFERIGSWRGDVSFGAWLKSIVRNRSVDSWRKQRMISFENMEKSVDIIDDCCESNLSDADAESKLKKVLTAVKSLSNGYRKIFTLYFLEGYDHDEISEILSISAGSSRSQLSRARNRLVSEFNR